MHRVVRCWINYNLTNYSLLISTLCLFGGQIPKYSLYVIGTIIIALYLYLNRLTIDQCSRRKLLDRCTLLNRPSYHSYSGPANVSVKPLPTAKVRPAFARRHAWLRTRMLVVFHRVPRTAAAIVNTCWLEGFPTFDDIPLHVAYVFWYPQFIYW